jgi:probable AcnD-accessory protein PrpF
MAEIAAYYMRGGTSKGVFMLADDLPADAAERDALLLRIIGSPDPYARHTDGMGGATSSTSKVVLIRASKRADCDVDYLFGAVAIGGPLIDWSGNCGNLSAAVGPFAIWRGFVPAREGTTTVRIWQQNIGQRIVAHVPCRNGHPLEDGDFREDGVPFGGAEIVLDYLEPGDSPMPLCPTGRCIDTLDVPGIGSLDVTLVTAGNPTVFVRAADVGLDGTELPESINGDAALLDRLEAIRAHAAVAMGLAPDAATATRERPGTPKVAWIAPPAPYRTSAGVQVRADDIDVLARILSMGRAHHAFTGTGAIALAVAATLPGSVVRQALRPGMAEEGAQTRIGHVSGTLAVGAVTTQRDGTWVMERAVMSRSARRLMTGLVHVPERC